MPNNEMTGGQGGLQVNTITAVGYRPIPDARINITDLSGEAATSPTATNSVGKTMSVSLPTPPLEASQSPAGGKPYSVYRVKAEAPGYAPAIVDGVQILPDRLALQPIVLNKMIPSEDLIAPHTLWGNFPAKIPEAEVKPLPEGDGFVVLERPVVPEFVVVHLGKPSETAKNVTVPFADYVKNVASCEIYATWPMETLRANILAIISFVLNRVYTEWYRGKGYDFTITNSTAYDQSFSYGRNIYREISQVVDDLFTTYVTRPGIRQPLFTQFCDGAKVRCPRGLEQWGSKQLGDDGWDALSILRTYYGANVFLKQAEKVEGVPVSYPGTVLRPGATGDDVRTIQRQLNRIAAAYPLIPKLRVDGIYGSKTKESVRVFQSVFDLPETGEVDRATWYAISNIYTAVSKLAEV